MGFPSTLDKPKIHYKKIYLLQQVLLQQKKKNNNNNNRGNIYTIASLGYYYYYFCNINLNLLSQKEIVARITMLHLNVLL